MTTSSEPRIRFRLTPSLAPFFLFRVEFFVFFFFDFIICDLRLATTQLLFVHDDDAEAIRRRYRDGG